MFYNDFTTAKLYPKIDSIANIIRTSVYEDPRKMYSNSQFETNISTDLIISGSRKPGLKSFISARRTSVLSQLNTLGINCETGIYGNETGIINFNLYQNFPNPFNPETKIKFELNQTGFVTLKVFNIKGDEIKTLVKEKLNSGSYETVFDGAALPSGLYFYKLEINGSGVTKKMLLIK